MLCVSSFLSVKLELFSKQRYRSRTVKVCDIKTMSPEEVDSMQEYEDRRREDILSWISPINATARQSEALKSRHGDTWTWILETEEFTHWLSQEKQSLFYTGVPGTGKTVPVAVIIDYLVYFFTSRCRDRLLVLRLSPGTNSSWDVCGYSSTISATRSICS